MKKFLILASLVIISSSNILSAQWEKCNNGLYGSAIKVLVNNENNIFAGTGDGSISIYR